MCIYCAPVGIKDYSLMDLITLRLECTINGLNIDLGYVSTWIDRDGMLCSSYETDDECGRKFDKEEISFCPKCGENLKLIKNLRDSGADLDCCFKENLQGLNVYDLITRELIERDDEQEHAE